LDSKLKGRTRLIYLQHYLGAEYFITAPAGMEGNCLAAVLAAVRQEQEIVWLLLLWNQDVVAERHQQMEHAGVDDSNRSRKRAWLVS
jgi:hypothetical protein